jgi:oligopeptide/dipeptide ABC transporter ATP-binding protein
MATGTAGRAEALLEIEGLSIDYPIAIGTVRAVEDLSLTLYKGETLGIVGESGCGKSTTGLAVLRLLRAPGRTSAGTVKYQGRDLLAIDETEMRRVRGRNIAMIFQNPLTSLNPVHTIKRHFFETLRNHNPAMREAEMLKLSGAMLEDLGIDKARLEEYPFQLSGGMRQRIMIGLALIMRPDIVIADEPTTALDVIVEAGFIDLLARLKREFDLSVILVSHNLGLVAEIADRIAVMYGGKLMEVAGAEAIFAAPLHPYTKGLMACVPNIELEQIDLPAMPGSPPDLVDPQPGCRFAARCPRVGARCRTETPELREIEPGHSAACWWAEAMRGEANPWLR